MENKEEKRVALVTGGAGSLGLATVRMFLATGFNVVIADQVTALDSVQEKELKGRDKECLYVALDVTSEKSVQQCIRAIMDRFRRLDVVVNSAGIANSGPTFDFETKTPHALDEFIRPIMVNVVGTFNVCRLATELILLNKPDIDGQRGVIINVGSIQGSEGQAARVAYATSKGAVHAMTLPMARDLAPQGIRVVCISPGAFESPMIRNQKPEVLERLLKSTPPFPPRIGQPNEFADMVRSIVDNHMLNGSVIRLDGAARL